MKQIIPDEESARSAELHEMTFCVFFIEGHVEHLYPGQMFGDITTSTSLFDSHQQAASFKSMKQSSVCFYWTINVVNYCSTASKGEG